MPRIESIEIYRVATPLLYPFRTAFGNDETIESVLVKMTADGIVGWGEAAPWRNPAYSPECGAGTYLVVRDFLAPLLLGQEIDSGEQLQAKLACVKSNPFAKASLDLAWWDLYAKGRQEPLWKTLGGKGPVVDVGADFGVMDAVDDLLRVIGEAMEAGYKRVKLKYRPGWELDMITAVRKEFPDTVFHVDCNSAYTLDDVAMIKALDDFDLAMVEQPLSHDDLVDHATLQAQLETPICLDESITSPAKARKAIQIKACGWVNIKPGRVGGLTQAVKIHDTCQAAGIPCWVGGMLECSVGAMHCVALATLPNFTYPNDIFPTDRFWAEDLGDPPIVHSGPSQISASEEPGCGAEPNAERLARCTLEHAALRA
jgi:o-succinylbenzoate synthase